MILTQEVADELKNRNPEILKYILNHEYILKPDPLAHIKYEQWDACELYDRWEDDGGNYSLLDFIERRINAN